MRSNRKTVILLIAIIVFLMMGAGVIFAQATVTEIVGKVEVKPPRGAWGTAWVGMKVVPGSTIATGFSSKAVLNLDNSTLYVNQLTRLTLEEIARRQGVIKTDLYIRTGSLEANVKPGTSYTHDFRVRSPVSTAAVRGTIIRYDGGRLLVKEGHATLFNIIGQPTTVFRGDSAMSKDGFDLLNGRLLLDLEYLIRLISRHSLVQRLTTTFISTVKDVIVIFYPIFEN